MSASLSTLAVQAGAFTLGCAAIHAARRHTAVLTQALTATAAIAGALVLIAAAVVWTPDDRGRFDEITVYAAFAGHPQGAE